MDYQVARKRMRELQVARDEYYNEHVRPLAREAELRGVTEVDIPEGITKEVNRLIGEIHTFGAQLFADPEIMDVMPVWNVCVAGLQVIEADFIDAFAQRDDRAAAMNEAFQRLGGVPQAVARAIESAGYHSPNREIMRSGWRVSFRCNESASRRLCAVMHRQFRVAVKNGAISVERYFADYALPGKPMAPPRKSS